MEPTQTRRDLLELAEEIPTRPAALNDLRAIVSRRFGLIFRGTFSLLFFFFEYLDIMQKKTREKRTKRTKQHEKERNDGDAGVLEVTRSEFMERFRSAQVMGSHALDGGFYVICQRRDDATYAAGNRKLAQTDDVIAAVGEPARWKASKIQQRRLARK